jgi:hypothetical protein
VTISRGRRGIRIFTPDKEQLRENVSRSGHRPLAIEFHYCPDVSGGERQNALCSRAFDACQGCERFELFRAFFHSSSFAKLAK